MAHYAQTSTMSEECPNIQGATPNTHIFDFRTAVRKLCPSDNWFIKNTSQPPQPISSDPISNPSIVDTPCTISGTTKTISVPETNVANLLTQQQRFSGNSQVLRTSSADQTKVTGAIWGPLNKTIICGHESGAVTMIDARSGQLLQQCKPHKGPVTDMQMRLHIPMFITSSKDHTAQLFSAYDLSSIRTYTAERPINSAAISPTRDHVLLGGGQEAHEVTTTAVGQGKFDARFYHLIYQEEFGRAKGHFGPINSVAFNSDGSGYHLLVQLLINSSSDLIPRSSVLYFSFATGGEEGYVRLHTFDSDYANLD
ncbi:eukaryotic translation initiation factor 3 subunit I [Paragonimus heterotremus]|uniref:Serine-threonine kinase receptor-associated protein n=1 Tax=Paragonimus heterotremus TaxID=100268 RepID=A0A8J4SQ50_9TREM|nr:eukaryotic translation initiation factor 3 subunit I [Paragonimus heterotremus]